MEPRVRLGTPQARPGFLWVEVGWGSWLVVGAGAVMSPAGTGQTLKVFSNLLGFLVPALMYRQ